MSEKPAAPASEAADPPVPTPPKKAAKKAAAKAPKPSETSVEEAVAAAAEAALRTETPSPEQSAPTGVRVVVAEDEALIRLDLSEMLDELGYVVVGQASDGEQAVELVKEHQPDVVIMDVKMPVLDGISAAEQIGKERIAPVIMLTAFSQKELVERARDAGVMAYIVKPFTQADLTPAIDIATSRWGELKALEAEIADLGERLDTRKAVDRAKGILMTKLKLSEPDAFRWIQKTAMDRRLGMREVADAVVAQMGST